MKSAFTPNPTVFLEQQQQQQKVFLDRNADVIRTSNFLKSPHHILKKLTLSSCLGLAQSTQGPKWKQNAQFCLPISL